LVPNKEPQPYAGQGTEDVKGKTAPARDQVPKQRQKLGKAQLREEAEAAFRAWWEKSQAGKDN
jgi:hypothetical protein